MVKGGTPGKMWAHAIWRSLLLIALGIFLRSMHSPQTYFTFEDTLTQIGLGYFFLFLLGFTRPVWQWAALAAILVGYWLAFVLYPLPPSDFTTPLSRMSRRPAAQHRTGSAQPALEQDLRLRHRVHVARKQQWIVLGCS